MESTNLQKYLLNIGRSESVDVRLQKMLSILRHHLDMRVAFISEFINGNRVFKFVDASDENVPIAVGDSDPLEETYCQRIVDGRLPRVIRDAQGNNATKDLAVTQKLGIGAYMGVPLTLSSGEVYGTFCCYKGEADNSLNDRDLSLLNAIAEISVVMIEEAIEAENREHEAAERIRRLLKDNKLEMHFQPIYNLHKNKVTGFESLSRFTVEPYRTPDIWFAEANQAGLGEALEMRAVQLAAAELHRFDSDVYLSVNASPEHIISGALASALENADAERIVLEVTEHSPVKDYPAFRKALEPLRKCGVRLAIDDAGAGYSSFQHVLELDADIIKLDISLTRRLNHEPRKLLLAKALCAFAKATKCKVVAEGIETAEELSALRELGVDMIQGYLIGRPMPVEQALPHAKRAMFAR